jgi:hypothetical protein
MSGVPQTFHSLAYFAAMRRVIFSPPPPMRSGSGFCTGFGSSGAFAIA